MNIALYFGSFNPIHIGHLIIAESVMDIDDIDKVWFVVSPQNPFKKSSGLLDETQRYYLTQLATQDNPNFYVSNIEFSMPKPSYTIDTLEVLEKKYPQHKFSLLMGGDNLNKLHKWKNYEKILENYTIYIYKRPNESNSDAIHHEHIQFLDVPLMEISSTDIRNRIKNGKSILYRVPDSVKKEIELSGYYL